MHRWANAFSSTANFVNFNSRKHEIDEKSRGGIAVTLILRMRRRRRSKSVLFSSSTATEEDATVRPMEATEVALAGVKNGNTTINQLGRGDINNVPVRSGA